MLKEIATNRCNEICNEISKEEWYKQTVTEIAECRTRILQGHNDFKVYEDLCLRLSCRTEEQIYMAAFQDGMGIK